MAGRARIAALTETLEALAREYFDVSTTDIALGTDPQPTALEYVCAKLEDGTTTKQLCRELSPALGYELTYDRLMRFLRDRFGEQQAAQAIDAARVRASHCMAETALEIVDAPAYDSVSVQQARSRAQQRNWMAERWNRQVYGASKDTTVTVNVGVLHLDSLRTLNASPSIVTAGPEPTVKQLPSSTG